MQPNLKSVQQRAMQYWFIDGLPEIGAGITILLVAVLLYFQASLPKGPVVSILFMLLIFAAAYGMRWLITRIKERTTYPRTGYLKPASRPPHPGWIVAAYVFAVLVLTANLFIVLTGQTNIAWYPLLAGVMMGFICIWTGSQLAIRRLVILGLLSSFAGGMLALSGLGDLIGAALLCGMIGLALIGMGWSTKRAYRKHFAAASIVGESSDERQS